MQISRTIKILTVLAFFVSMPLPGASQSQMGSLEVNVKNVKIDGKPAKLSRKRFYLLPGGLADNAALLTRIKGAEITSKNCYYKGIQASDQYICWLKAENCESPFCRVVDGRYLDSNDKLAVPEFIAAYNKGLPLYKGNTAIAREWLLTNMPDNLVNGYYRQQQKVLGSVLAGSKPLQSSMTDTAGIRTIFLDIALGTSAKSKYLVTNVLPIEIGDKSYVWTCEKDVEAGKKVNLDISKAGKNCEITVRDLRVCATTPCSQK
jgi:hypothetical protein